MEMNTCEDRLHLRDTGALSVSRNVLSIARICHLFCQSNRLPHTGAVHHAKELESDPANVPQEEVVIVAFSQFVLP
jgi:hypothetical protein